jgi:hypothetical protein
MRRTHHIFLAIILLVAFGLRLGVAWTQDPFAPYDRMAGSDEWWYLEYGFRLVADEDVEPLSSAPLYLALLGGIRYTLEPERTEKEDKHVILAPPGGGLNIKSVAGAPSPETVRIMQLVQAIMGTATCYFVFRIARTLSGDPRPGLAAAAILATSVALIVNAGDIMTETSYIFFLTAGMMVYIDLAVGERSYRYPMWVSALVGGLFGLATLTRAALLLFPLGIAFHALLVVIINRRRGIASALTLRGITALLTIYVAVCSIWTIYYAVRWDELVIGAKGFSAFLYLGTQEEVAGPEAIDEELGAEWTDPVTDDDFVSRARAIIGSAPVAYLRGQVRDLAAAYAQPFGTVSFRGASIKSLALNWWQGDRSLSGLVQLTQTDAFVPKLMIYIVHYGGIGLGLVGIWLTRHNWRAGLPLIGFIVYLSLLHLVLLVLPRYLFPALPLWWAFGGVALIRVWDAITVPSHHNAQARALAKPS